MTGIVLQVDGEKNVQYVLLEEFIIQIGKKWNTQNKFSETSGQSVKKQNFNIRNKIDIEKRIYL